MITRFLKPASLDEALAAVRDNPGAVFLAGGTYLLTPACRNRPMVAVALDGVLGNEIRRTGSGVSIGALATLQELVDSPDTPALLRDAALGMANRNIRNRATIAGNIAANKACSSLNPALLASGARLRVRDGAGGQGLEIPLARYLEAPGMLIAAIEIPAETGRREAYRRWARTACDLAVISVAVSFRSDAGSVRDLRIGAGGVGPHARRLSEAEALFEGGPLPGRDEIERLVLPLLETVDDHRAGAEYKRMRAAQLLASALLEAEEASE